MPHDAEPGAVLCLAWTVEIADGTQTAPFNAVGMFVRLTGPDGAVTETTAW